jgi:sulfate permease, SulP family
VFYVGLLLSGTSIDTARQQGLLIGAISEGSVWQLPFADLLQADWGAVVGQAGNILVILGLTVITLLMNVSGLELVLKREMDFNRELRLA